MVIIAILNLVGLLYHVSRFIIGVHVRRQFGADVCHVGNCEDGLC